MPLLLQRKPESSASPPPAARSAATRPGEHAQALAFHLPRATDQAAASGLASQAEPLPAGVRGEMESRFGQDLSGVRVHQGERAAAGAEAVGAQAYTVGSDIVFGRGRFDPSSAEGGRLLAHELAHVVQQRGASPGALSTLAYAALERDADAAAARAMDGGPALVSGAAPRGLQRQTVTGSRDTVTTYELSTSGQQVASSRTMRGVRTGLAYDPATTQFTVTFRLAWIFPHSWNATQRSSYVQAFESSVRGVWNDRFLLQESAGARRSAHVQIAFDEVVVPQLANETEELLQWAGPANGDRWKMDVRNQFVRENVDRSTHTVQLGATSNQQQSHNAAQLRQQAPFSYSGTGGNQTFRQAASPHEFGHMIGLGDEYLEDTDSVPSAARGHINSRIMNVGETVTADAYQPFAEWLSGLTSTTWRVGRRV